MLQKLKLNNIYKKVNNLKLFLKLLKVFVLVYDNFQQNHKHIYDQIEMLNKSYVIFLIINIFTVQENWC